MGQLLIVYGYGKEKVVYSTAYSLAEARQCLDRCKARHGVMPRVLKGSEHADPSEFTTRHHKL